MRYLPLGYHILSLYITTVAIPWCHMKLVGFYASKLVKYIFLLFLSSFCLSVCVCLHARMCTRAQLVGVSSFLSSWVLGTEPRFPAQEPVFLPTLLSCQPLPPSFVVFFVGQVLSTESSIQTAVGKAASARAKRNTASFTHPSDPCFIPSSLIHTVCEAQFEVWVVRRVKFSILT